MAAARARGAEPASSATLDAAVDRVRELSLRLWAVRDQHRPVRRLGRVRCTCCGQAYPCGTLLAAGCGPRDPRLERPRAWATALR